MYSQQSSECAESVKVARLNGLPIPLQANAASTTLPFLIHPSMRVLSVSLLNIEQAL